MNWKTVTIFISSTFLDMEAERDYLKKYVVPYLDEYFSDKYISIKLIDLRWGIDAKSIEKEAETEVEILKVCFSEIDRCRPFFIGLLGDRYGWIPSEEQIKNAIMRSNSAIKDENRDHYSKSITSLEIMHGTLYSRYSKNHSIFFFRETDSYLGMNNETLSIYRDAYSKMSTDKRIFSINALKNLKDDIILYCKQNDIEDNIHKYKLNWNGLKFTGLEIWGETVKECLIREIEKEFQNQDKKEKKWFEVEELLFDEFVFRNTENFSGRNDVINSYINSLIYESNTTILSGFSGAGKSATICKIYLELLNQRPTNTIILGHSAGISPLSIEVRNMLCKWNIQLKLAIGLPIDEKEYDVSKIDRIDVIIIQFKSLCSIYNENNIRIILLIDALDKFENDFIFYFSWLPQHNISLLATATDKSFKRINNLPPKIYVYSFPQFEKEDAIEMIYQACLSNGKKINKNIVDQIVEKKKTNDQYSYNSPLWLNLVINVLFSIDSDDFKIIRSYKNVSGSEAINKYLSKLIDSFSPEPEELFLELIDRASEDFGRELTIQTFNLLAISKDGFRQKDLESLIGENWSEIKFALLRRWFKGIIREIGSEKEWIITHEILKNSLLDKLSNIELSNLNGLDNLHQTVVNYILFLPENDSLRIRNVFYHLCAANDLPFAADYLYRADGSTLDYTLKYIADYCISTNYDFSWYFDLIKTGICSVESESFRSQKTSIYMHDIFNQKLSHNHDITEDYLLKSAGVKKAYYLYRDAIYSLFKNLDLRISRDKLLLYSEKLLESMSANYPPQEENYDLYAKQNLNIGHLLFQALKCNRAEGYLNTAYNYSLRFCSSSNNSQESIILINQIRFDLGNLYLKVDNIEKAKRYINKQDKKSNLVNNIIGFLRKN